MSCTLQSSSAADSASARTSQKTVPIIKLFILEPHYVPQREHSPSKLQRRVMARDHKHTLCRQLNCLLFLSGFNQNRNVVTNFVKTPNMKSH
jgi:hypothetical protein